MTGTMAGGAAMAPMPAMCGQTWTAAAAFLGMWTAMTAAMMGPSLVPALWRHRRAFAGAGARRPNALTAIVAAGYLLVWTAAGAVVFLLQIGLLAAAARLPWALHAAPLATALVVLAAGGLQLTRWKARRLACCRASPAGRVDPPGALAQGLRLGLDCCACCAPAMAVLFALGLMDLRLMVVATAAITAERLARHPKRVTQGLGLAALGLGGFLLTLAVVPG